MHHLKRHTRAFTIVELLVVIGIIAILLGILIPVVSSVRKAAYVSSSRNNIQLIVNAIERYHAIHQAYPGLFGNAAISGGVVLTGAGTGALTSTENCVLALCGGVYNNAGTMTYAPADLGKGPLTFGASPKRLGYYMEANNKILSLTGAGLDPSTYFGNTHNMASTYDMSGGPPGVPEFIDAFPQGMPIIYIRARVKAPGVVGVEGVNGQHNGVTVNSYQYDARDLLPYAVTMNKTFVFDSSSFGSAPTGATDQGNPSGAYPASGGTTFGTINFVGSYQYFRNASTNTARQADSFLLISPGEDRKYGTSDDICNFTF